MRDPLSDFRPTDVKRILADDAAKSKRNDGQPEIRNMQKWYCLGLKCGVDTIQLHVYNHIKEADKPDIVFCHGFTARNLALGLLYRIELPLKPNRLPGKSTFVLDQTTREIIENRCDEYLDEQLTKNPDSVLS